MMPSTSRGHSSAGDVSKRVYREDSLLPAKRVKQEDPLEENQQMNIDDDIDYDNDIDYEDTADYEPRPDVSLEEAGIPDNLEKFVSFILHLPTPVQNNRFTTGLDELMQRLKSIRAKFTYDSVSHYLQYNVPYLLCKLGKEMGIAMEEKGHFPSVENCESVINAYVLMKEEFNDDIDFKLSILSPKHTLMEDCPKAGDIVLVKMKTERCSNEKEGVFQDPAFLGIFLSPFTRVLQPELFSIENLVLNEAPEFKNDYLCEESVLRTRKNTSLYDRSDYHLGIHKLFNFLPILQMAKALFLLDDYPYKEHFLKPVMVIKTSGVGINEELITDPDKADTFQKANDLVGQNDPSSSSFLAVNLEVPYYQSFITPVLKQLVSNLSFFKTKDDEKTPILIISEDEDFRKDLCTHLKTEGFDGKNEVIIDPSDDVKVQIDELLIELYAGHIATLEKETEQKKKGKERYSKCIEHLKNVRAINDLSPHWIAEMLRTRKDIKRKMLKDAKVIITNFETVCSDLTYLATFNPKTVSEQRILCCIICEAHNHSELKTLALTNLGIKKYILLGTIAELRFQEIPEQETFSERFISYTRSLFERLYSLHSKGPSLINSSFVD